jgi:hypothetical protein
MKVRLFFSSFPPGRLAHGFFLGVLAFGLGVDDRYQGHIINISY